MSASPAEFVVVITVALVFVAIVVALFALIVRVSRALFGRGRRLESELGVEVLEQRLRRGEISFAEYEVARRALGR